MMTSLEKDKLKTLSWSATGKRTFPRERLPLSQKIHTSSFALAAILMKDSLDLKYIYWKEKKRTCNCNSRANVIKTLFPIYNCTDQNILIGFPNQIIVRILLKQVQSLSLQHSSEAGRKKSLT